MENRLSPCVYSEVTMTSQIAVYSVPPIVVPAVIVAVPADTPVTTPFSTVATLVSLESHVTACPAGFVVAVRVFEPPTATLSSVLSRLIPEKLVTLFF